MIKPQSLYTFRNFAFLLCALSLCGCLGGVIPFRQATDYTLNGLDGDDDMRQYAKTILEQRLQDNIDYTKGSDDFNAAVASRELKIQGDLTKALKAKGYYDATIEFIDSETDEMAGVYDIQPGALYTIQSIEVHPNDNIEAFDFDTIQEGDGLDAEKVLTAQQKLYDAIQKEQCHLSLNVVHRVELNQRNKTAHLTYDVEQGAEAKLGDVIFVGHDGVDEEYLRKMIPWKHGACFQSKKIDALVTKILKTGLFSRAEPSVPDTPDADGYVAITINLKERARRSIKAGASYYTDEGVGVTLGWEHRNLLGGGENLEIEFNMSEINQSLDTSFVKPYFLRKDQNLELNTSLRQQDTDAYNETALDFSAGLNRQFSRRSSGSIGFELGLSEIEEDNDKRTFGLLSFPMRLVYDNRDNQLDPHEGWRLTADFEPFYDALGESDPFTKFEASASTYVDVSDNEDIVLAFRANIGSIVGGGNSNIPATERFYAGGGGSIRGFEYQGVGPFDNGEPTGGRSKVIGGTEVRWKMTDTFGTVAFVDGGSVSNSASPDFDNLSFGAGVGARYYTDFGPLRFDVAVPLNQKDDLDQNYQFYITIGQAF